MINDWNEVRYNLDKSPNYLEIKYSPWYSEAVYDKFSPTEYQRRHQHAKQLMERDGLDALILTGGKNIYSFGGAVTWATGLIDQRGVCQYVVLPKDGEPMLIYPHAGCHIEAARLMVGISDVRGDEGGKFAKVIADFLKEHGVEKGHIGITAVDRIGPEYMGVKTYLDLVNLLPEATFERLPHLLHELTAIKSQEEIEAMSKAGELAVQALEAIAATARPGIREYQLEAAGTFAILNGGGDVHLMMIGSTSMQDPKGVYPNPIPSQRVLKEGDIILDEIVATYKGYSAKIGHPITVGQPTVEVETFFEEVVLEGFQALNEKLMPGNTLEQVRQATRFFRENGAQSLPITMHGLDLITALPVVYVDRVASVPGDEDILPGKAYAIEISPVDSEGLLAMFMARTYIMTEDGKRDLTPFPMDEVLVAGG
jgi:Xaa-Pro aminopeptidase